MPVLYGRAGYVYDTRTSKITGPKPGPVEVDWPWLALRCKVDVAALSSGPPIKPYEMTNETAFRGFVHSVLPEVALRRLLDLAAVSLGSST